MTYDWIDISLRVMTIAGFSVGAYRGYSRMRAQGVWTTAAAFLSGLVLLVYIGVGTVLVAAVVVYGTPRHTVAIIVAIVAYFAAGYFATRRLISAIFARFGGLRSGFHVD